MNLPAKPLSLVLQIMIVCGFTPAFAQALPPCSASNYDAGRDLFTPDKNNSSIDFDHPVGSQLVNQQCLLTVVPRDGSERPRSDSGSQTRKVLSSNGTVAEGRYVVFLSNGGDGGSGGSARPEGGIGGGGGGGGAGAAQVRQEILLTPGVYKLTLGAGGPGGRACRGTFGGSPGWGGSPTNMVRLSDGQTVAGAAGADTWQRPTRYANEKRSGPQDGHGGTGPGKSAGGAGSNVDPGFEKVAQAGVRGPAGTTGQPGDAGGEIPGQSALRIGGGGGGGAGLGDGGDGAGDVARQVAVSPPEVGGLGAGGGGGAGRTNFCSAGAPGGNGYIALRPR